MKLAIIQFIFLSSAHAQFVQQGAKLVGAASTSGNSLTLNLALTFSQSFAGNRIFYLAARDAHEGNNTGWQPMATRAIQ